MTRPEVRHTEDFDRIAAIPRREPDLEIARAYAEALTPIVSCAGSGVALRDWQAFVIAEGCSTSHGKPVGGFYGLPVGFGKTIPMFVIPRLLGAVRPLVIVPGAGLRDKTNADFASFTGKWRAPNPMPLVITQESLERGAGVEAFLRMRPDYIALEEADEWANFDSSASRVLERYVVDAGDDVSVHALTGTPTRRSLTTYAHILRWCLRDWAPVPHLDSEVKMWGRAIDDYGTRNSTIRRPGPGPLGRNVTEARAWFAERLRQTPGVVLIDGDSAGDVPLVIRHRLALECPEIDRHYKMFLEYGASLDDQPGIPDGLVFSDPLSRWRIDGQLGLGYFLRYVAPGPPEPWRLARRIKDAFVRRVIAWSTDSARPLDTEQQVLNRFPEHNAVRAWAEAREKYGRSFPTEPVWISRAGIQSVLDWLAESRAPSIIWTGGTEFARALQAASGLPYFGAQGLDASGRALHLADPKQSMICSWHANKRGFNLQAWRRNGITQPPQSAKYLEQIFGRPHRSDQDEAVTFDLFIASGGTLDAFDSAVSEARFAKATVGLTQKILRATVVKKKPRITPSNRFRWASRAL